VAVVLDLHLTQRQLRLQPVLETFSLSDETYSPLEICQFTNLAAASLEYP
jgi:hypothetical protein